MGGGERESPKERIERLVQEGNITREAVAEAERLWEDRLRRGVKMPNGETVHVTPDDLYHVIVDPRIWRHPERIEVAIAHVFEIRPSHSGRREALSRWTEQSQFQLASLILEAGCRLWSIHLIDERRLRRYIRTGGEVLWRQ